VAARPPFDASVAAAGRIKVSGLARKIAADHGIDLSGIRGSGPEGRIVKRDLYQASGTAAAATGVVSTAHGVRARVPMTGLRRTIAERMVTAKTTAAHTYAFFEVDLTKLAAARDTLLAREKEFGGRISMLAFYAKALALACRHVPICNATLIGDEIIVWDHVHIGIAIALPGRTEFESGLMVPVLRHAERKGLQEIDREIKDLVDRARNNRLTSADLADGTVTLSSTGGFLSGQWCVSTPLLNQPQVLNFQPGTPLKKPVVVGEDQIAVRQMLPCGLSFDHRAMDGEPIGRFVHKLSDLLTHPELMLA
jgi:pyruvate/2-oxoglutarate dehydrogenase complex dihydrolipoamide acyltransferase (E2) component